VERPIVLPRGWFEWRGAWTGASLDGGFDAAGRRVAWPDPIRRDEAELSLRVGLRDGVELWWRGGLGVQGGVGGMLDPAFGARIGLAEQAAPASGAAVELSWEPAAGREGPATLASDPSGATGLAMSSGTTDAAAGLVVRRHLGAIRITARGGIALRLPGRVGFESVGGGAGRARLDPGDRLPAEVELLLQAGPLAATGAIRATWIAASRVRDEGPWRRLDDAGVAVDLRAGGVASLTRGVDVSIGGAWALRGPPSSLHPNPELAAAWGRRIDLALELRH
jgi:hypothetical protein